MSLPPIPRPPGSRSVEVEPVEQTAGMTRKEALEWLAERARWRCDHSGLTWSLTDVMAVRVVTETEPDVSPDR